jgi:hypothetical protein
MAHAQISRINWHDLDAATVELLGSDAPAVAADVADGVSSCWQAGRCQLIVRIDALYDRRECVIVAAQGADLDEIMPAIYTAAQRAECARIRWHTARPALARLVAKQYNVIEIEYVFSVEVGQ